MPLRCLQVDGFRLSHDHRDGEDGYEEGEAEETETATQGSVTLEKCVVLVVLVVRIAVAIAVVATAVVVAVFVAVFFVVVYNPLLFLAAVAQIPNGDLIVRYILRGGGAS